MRSWLTATMGSSAEDVGHGTISQSCLSFCLTASELSLLLCLTNARLVHLHLLCSSAGWSAVIERTGLAFQ